MSSSCLYLDWSLRYGLFLLIGRSGPARAVAARKIRISGRVHWSGVRRLAGQPTRPGPIKDRSPTATAACLDYCVLCHCITSLSRLYPLIPAADSCACPAMFRSGPRLDTAVAAPGGHRSQIKIYCRNETNSLQHLTPSLAEKLKTTKILLEKYQECQVSKY